MTQFPHDRFAKNLLESLLAPGGQVTTALTILWILTPTLAAPTLTGFGAANEVSWEDGVYLLPPLQKTGIIVIHQLPAIPDTLWFRLLGKGKVQQQAISEVAALPADSPYLTDTLKLLGNLRIILEAQKSRKTEDQELIMQLSPLYLEQIQAAEERGEQLGERKEGQVLILRQLKRRIGAIQHFRQL